MIDISSLVFDTVYSRLSVLYPNANITAGYDEKFSGSLNLVVREVSNEPYASGNTDDCAENYTTVVFEIEAESDKDSTARSQCKAILNDADAVMQEMKFRRTYMSRAFNLDRTRYRQYARYEAIVGKPQEINGNTVYQMYRR